MPQQRLGKRKEERKKRGGEGGHSRKRGRSNRTRLLRLVQGGWRGGSRHTELAHGGKGRGHSHDPKRESINQGETRG